MNILSRSAAIQRINFLHEKGQPFFFMTDFLGEKAVVEPLDGLAGQGLFFDFETKKNCRKTAAPSIPFSLEKMPESFEVYQKRFDFIKENILFGNSFLTNLTCQTEISTNFSLENIFSASRARFKILYKNRFVCFSPEPFVRITPGGRISSFPMKGTIDAGLENAAERILADEKEAAEHATIVDLIRNDLSQIASKVRVRRWRYLEKVFRHDGRALLQVSSEVCGQVRAGEKPGELLFKLLPAGSISGAPKAKTVELIRAAEGYERGFYTGVAGIFTGRGFEMQSCVMIRFIEKIDGKLFFKSGGGITHKSDALSEYHEMIQKIYVPIAI